MTIAICTSFCKLTLLLIYLKRKTSVLFHSAYLFTLKLLETVGMQTFSRHGEYFKLNDRSPYIYICIKITPLLVLFLGTAFYKRQTNRYLLSAFLFPMFVFIINYSSFLDSISIKKSYIIRR